MAGSRRGTSADLREALLSLVRTTLDQVGAVRDVALRQAQSQRIILDQALMGRRRKDQLAALGEEIYAQMLTGQLDELAAEPRIAELISAIAELDEAMEQAEPAEKKPANWDKSRARHSTRRPGGARVWRPGESTLDTEQDADAVTKPRRRTQRAAPGEKRGGIAFVPDADTSDDDDLGDYMHDDDLPTEERD